MLRHVHDGARAPDRAAATPASASEAVLGEIRGLLGADLAIQSLHRPLDAQLTGFAGRSLRFARLSFSAHTTASRGAPPSPQSRVLVSFHTTGDAVVSQGGREATVTPGSFFVLDPCSPFSIITGAMTTSSVYLLRSTLLALVPDLSHLTATPIDCATGAPAVLRSAVDTMIACADALDPDSAERIAEALPYLVAAALRQAVTEAPVPTRLRQLHKERIRRHVRENLGDCELSPHAVARAVGLSARHVHDLFTDEPVPLMKWIWSERLERCRREVCDPRLASRSIGEIAYAWGFRDLSHFSRAFKARYGAGPRELRQAQLPAPRAEAD